MPSHTFLNVYRHPSIPVPRGQERYDQADDPFFRTMNDDIDMRLAPADAWRASRVLDLDPHLPFAIWHSDTCCNRHTARLFVETLAPRWTPSVVEVPDLSEAPFHLRALVTREAFESSSRPPWLVRHAYLKAVLNDDRDAVAGGRAGVTRRVLALRRRLDELPPTNLLWLTHGLLMPFLHLTLLDGIEPDDWTLADVLAIPAFGYAEGFALRVRARQAAAQAAAD